MPDVFRLLADPTRRDLLDALRAGERSVSDLVRVARISQPGVSKQLRILKEVGVVTVRRDGRRRMYALRGVPLKEASDWLRGYARFWGVGPSTADVLSKRDARRTRRRSR